MQTTSDEEFLATLTDWFEVAARVLVYGAAAAAVGVAVALGHLPLFQTMRFGLLFFVVAVVAGAAGTRPGIVATLLAALGLEFFFLVPTFSLQIADTKDVFRLVIFIVGALTISVFIGKGRLGRVKLRSPLAGTRRPAPEALLASLADYAVCTLDAEACVTGWDGRAEQLTGYTAEQVRGRPFNSFYPPASAPAITPQAPLQEAAATGKPKADQWLVKADGSRFLAEIGVLARGVSPRGQPAGFLVLLRDRAGVP